MYTMRQGIFSPDGGSQSFSTLKNNTNYHLSNSDKKVILILNHSLLYYAI